MSAPKTTAGIKVPPFTRDDFGLWKMKMMLFIKASNPLYIGILENRLFVPMKSVGETTTPEGTRVPQSHIPKELFDYTDTDKELIRLDTGLMLILTDSADKEMSYHLMNCVSGKQMWDTINLIMEGTEDVQENRLDILTSQYESFRSLPGQSITQVFEKYTKLLNELTMKGKTYPLRETNRKEVIIEAEMDSVNLGVDESDYYTLEELEQMEDKTMAYLAAKFSHNRFKRNPKYKFKGLTNRFQKIKYSPGTGFKGGYKTGMIDRSKSRCFNCNELGHFATECRKPRQARDKKDVYEKKDSYEDLKKENAKLKQQLETLSGKQKGKVYIT
ncbi:hypothetical protein POM88_030940 [Heracleum sosnowskyi]|uniref:CCHC-type domain-containing protein n=1 Tax=Heracleum sosnowskyi TaxID=360622 RepID=A0AAD8MJ25_9APIA|nr:hypothetical protein POM88_030940 [Heracleum sosnowskyi]